MEVILNHLVTVGLQTGPMVAVAVVIMLSSASREVSLPWLGIALGLVLLEDFLLTGAWMLVPQPESWGQWNWTGKALALAGTICIATLPAFGLARCGFTWRQKPGSWLAWAVVATVCVGLLAVAVLNGDGRPDPADTIAFQWTMPGLEEEAFYRGTLLFALDRAFLARRDLYGARVGPAMLLGAILFGSVHGISRHAGTIEILPLIFASHFAAGLLLVWVRTRTGSLLAAVVGHNVGNGVFALV